MDDVGSITNCIQIGSDAFKIGLFQDRLLRILAGPEELAGAAGQDFKFCVAGSGAHDRHLQMTGGIVLLQLVEERNRVFGGVDEFRFGHVEKGF